MFYLASTIFIEVTDFYLTSRSLTPAKTSLANLGSDIVFY